MTPRTLTLSNGVRVVAFPLPHLASVSAGVFVRTGSRLEAPRLNGISHVVEHMAFKGTATRDCQRINLDAERLGAEVNAYTDKDHTAYHMRGLAQHAGDFLRMLADIVMNSTFPAEELERERQVILHELTEDEDDALSTAFKLFDTLCFGRHPVAQPVIGQRRNIERFSREDLLGYVRSRYTGSNVVVAVAGGIDADQVLRQAAEAFAALPPGEPHGLEAPGYRGGVATRAQSGVSQTHVVLGFPLPPSTDPLHRAGTVAAALFGEGMSSPLMDRVREQKGLVYYAACSADVSDVCGQFVVEASTSSEQLDDFVAEVAQLLKAQLRTPDAVSLERAHNQLAVRQLEVQERPMRLLEEAAQDLFVHGRLVSQQEKLQMLRAVDAAQVREAFASMLSARPSVAVAGRVRKGARERLAAVLGEPLA